MTDNDYNQARAKEAAKYARKIIAEVCSVLNQKSGQLKKISDALIVFEENPERIWEYIDMSRMILRLTVSKLNSISSAPMLELEKYYDIDNEMAYICEKLDRGVDGIEVRSSDGRIYIKMPLLDTRKQMLSKVTEKNPWSLKNNTVYAAAVSRALDRLDNNGDFDSRRYGKKTLYYVFVNNSATANISDCDNYNTNAITNTITARTPGGDNPDCCRVVYDALAPGALPEGTYITLMPYEEAHFSASDIAEFWINNPPKIFNEEEFNSQISEHFYTT